MDFPSRVCTKLQFWSLSLLSKYLHGCLIVRTLNLQILWFTKKCPFKKRNNLLHYFPNYNFGKMTFSNINYNVKLLLLLLTISPLQYRQIESTNLSNKNFFLIFFFFSWKVRFGDFDLESTEDDVTSTERDVLKVFFHPDFDDAKLYFDVAIVKVDIVDFSIFVRPGLNSIWKKKSLFDFVECNFDKVFVN